MTLDQILRTADAALRLATDLANAVEAARDALSPDDMRTLNAKLAEIHATNMELVANLETALIAAARR